MITSKNNELIKTCIQIKSKKYSRERGLCFVESIKLVRELYKKGLTTHILISENKSNLAEEFLDTQVELISRSISEYICDSVTTDGVFAICKIPRITEVNYSKCLILDRIQDPSNLGAIIRSACAFGFDTIFSVDSVYPFSFKSIRSSMGHVFSVNLIDTNIESLKVLKKNNSITFYVADMDGLNISKISRNKSNSIAIIIGNEGSGVSDELIQLADQTISIPMNDGVESLNASVSAGIIMYLLK